MYVTAPSETMRAAPSVLLISLLVVACDLSSSKRLELSDCRARKLIRTDTCKGRDEGFQECRFYLRAGGVPNRSWCEELASSAHPSTSELPECDFDKPAAWAKVNCGIYRLPGKLTCYACVASKREAQRTYVYGYDAACSHGFEQVTCNYDPVRAGIELQK
jgi:hypothetical protein